MAEVESWIKDKSSGMKVADFGKDEDSSVKLLTKHKALELEIDTYSGIVKVTPAIPELVLNIICSGNIRYGQQADQQQPPRPQADQVKGRDAQQRAEEPEESLQSPKG